MQEPQRGVRRQELELPFLSLVAGGPQSAGAATAEIEHSHSGQLNVRPTTRGQAVDRSIFAGVAVQRPRRGERLCGRLASATSSSLTRVLLMSMTLRGSRRRRISSCSTSQSIASACSTLHAVAKATAGSNSWRYATAASSARSDACRSLSRRCDRRVFLLSSFHIILPICRRCVRPYAARSRVSLLQW